MRQDHFSSLVTALYDASLDPSGWPGLAQVFARTFGSESCAIFEFSRSQDSAAFLAITGNYDAKAISDYEAYYHQRDVWAAEMLKGGTDQATLSGELLKESDFLNGELYDGYAKRIGIFSGLVSLMTLNSQTLGAIGIHRPHGARVFNEDDKRDLTLLLPHLSRTMQLSRHLKGLTRDHQILVDTMERLAVGMIAVDAQARMLYANPTAERLLGTGLGLTCRLGYLSATDPIKNGELRRLIQQAGLASRGRPSEAGGLLTVSRTGRCPMPILICPLRPPALSWGPSMSAALLIFGDPDARAPTSVQALIELYGLTRAEARLMAALVDGERLEDYADRQRISLNTARTQSKRVFAKTGRGRQADLIREALTNAALRAANLIPGDR